MSGVRQILAGSQIHQAAAFDGLKAISTSTSALQSFDESPEPGVNDRILLDARAPLQACTTEAQAKAIFTANGDVGFFPDQYVNFITNFDGAGTKAIRCDWSQFTECLDAERQMRFVLPDPKPFRFYFKAKHYMGKHPADPTGWGTNNIFQICNAACGNAARKMFLSPRVEPNLGNFARFGYTWAGPAPAQILLTLSTPEIQYYAPEDLIDLQALQGQVVEEAVYMQAATGDAGVFDGVAKVWINGTLMFAVENFEMYSNAYHRIQFPTVVRAAQYDQSEYWWDIVAWAPEGY